jgi:DNA-binding protein HU-beta
VNKAQLIEKIAASAELSKAEATRAVDGFLSAVTDSLAAGEDVALTGFGSFTVRERAARKGRNPQTGAEIQIAKANVASLKVGKGLKDAINA